MHFQPDDNLVFHKWLVYQSSLDEANVICHNVHSANVGGVKSQTKQNDEKYTVNQTVASWIIVPKIDHESTDNSCGCA